MKTEKLLRIATVTVLALFFVFLASIAYTWYNVANAATVDPNSCKGNVEREFQYIMAQQRTDDSPLPASEIAGHTIYTGTKPGVYPDSYYFEGSEEHLKIDGKPAQKRTVYVLPDSTCYAAIKTHDTGGRVSAFSPEITVETGNAGKPVIPATVSDLTVVRNGTSDRDYILSFSEVTKDTEGRDLRNPIEKYFLFQHFADGSFKWLQDIYYDKDMPLIRTYRKGDVTLSVEAEYKFSEGNSIVSEKSELLTFTVDDYTEDSVDVPVVQPPEPEPPKSGVLIVIPEGAETMEIFFE